jgi:hypothetical protein
MGITTALGGIARKSRITFMKEESKKELSKNLKKVNNHNLLHREVSNQMHLDDQNHIHPLR